LPRLPGVGERIADRLRRLGFSKQGRLDIARFCAEKGYRPQYVYAWLAGRTPTYENLEHLAGDLGVSRSWLAVGDEAEVARVQEAGRESRGRRPAPRASIAPGRVARDALLRARVAPAFQVLDFARLREVTAKLIQLEAQLAAIFEAFPDLYVWTDGAGTIIDWKGGRIAVPDVLLGPCIGQPIDAVFPDDTGRRLREAVTTAIATAEPTSVDSTAPVRGEERSFEARLMPLEPPGAPRPHVLIVVRDTTDRLRAERAVRSSEARYRALVEGSIQGIYIVQDTVIRFVNQALCDIFGYPGPDALVGQPALILKTPGQRERFSQHPAARLRRGSAPTRYEYEGLRRDGARIWLESVASVVSWEGGSAVLRTVQDVTERKRAQDAATALAEAGRELAGTLDLGELVERILGRVSHLLGVGRAQIFALDPGTGVLQCLASHPETMVGRELAAGEGVVGRAVELGRAVASADVLSDPTIVLPEWAVALTRTTGFPAVLAVPLAARARVIGALAVADVPGRVFTGDEQALLAAFADHAAVALDNARRYRELEERVRALQSPPQG
jgi:PAS domain S-box-containing protein